MSERKDGFGLKVVYRIWQFRDADGKIAKLLKAGEKIDEILKSFEKSFLGFKELHKNVFLNEGINTIWTLVCGGSATPFDNANAHIGVGDGTDLADPTQTGLTGTNKAYAPMDAGYPIYGSDQKAVFRATFDGNTANFTWNEWTVANGADDTAVNLNRKVESLGTKTSGSTWVLEVELSIS